MNSFPATDLILNAIFLVAAATTAIGALIAALATRVIRSVCGLALCSFGLAGLYYFLRSPFLSLMEILIYVGAVCVTIVFAIMLSDTEETDPNETRRVTLWWGGFSLVVSLGIFWGLWRLGLQQAGPIPATRLNDGSVKAIGVSLLTTYSMAFELISLALLVAILGALAIARTGRTKAPTAPAEKPL